MNTDNASSIPEPVASDAPPLAHAVKVAVAVPVPKPSKRSRVGAGLWNWVMPMMVLVPVGILAVYAAPYLVYQWRLMEAQADAESYYIKRRAELKAEAEQADLRIDLLDKRVHLTSLGFREVVRKVTPNVVNVVNYREPKEEELPKLGKKNLIYDPDNDKKYLQLGVGSGVIIKPGVILTNNHVVRNGERLRVSFASGHAIGVDPSNVVVDAITDLAVIKLPENLSRSLMEEAKNAAVFADSDKDVQVGDWALAIGSPLGLKLTVTQGVISAKGRLLSMLDMVELLQTDAAINPGNSGGPLFDQYGRIAGINVAIASDNGLNQGIGFAIPSNTAKKIAEQLLIKGEVPRGYLGIAMEELPAQRAKALKLDDGGIVVKDVEKGQAAAKAGLQSGDIIIRVNKDALNRTQPIRHFRQLVVDLEPGATATLEALRGDERRQFEVTVGKRPGYLP
ncbi:MAG TPA: trypsin-like peptidase domain-containing protein [Gemmataceae bacterium]|nr:trypsin-like peptidase domain-containing protein [Gemmataceae bacterium]